MDRQIDRGSGGASAPATMRAVTRHEYGGTDGVRVERVPVPVPRAGEVLVRVEWSALERGTWHVMAGEPLVARPAFGLPRPRQPVLGTELAGVVVACGTGVAELVPGDAVAGTSTGAFAEFAVTTAKRLRRRPDGLTARAAAGLAVSAVTAQDALEAAGGVGAGDRVLVVGASGGVGSYAVQLAVARGAHVTGVASAGKADAVRALGAHDVIAYETESITARGRHDVVLDIGGGRPVRELRRGAEPDGAIVFVGVEGAGGPLGGLGRAVGAQLRSPFVRGRMRMLASRDGGPSLDVVLAEAAAGRLRTMEDRVVGLAGVVEAIDALVAGRVCGKVLVEIDR